MQRIKILALDTATKTGYASNCFKKITSGVVNFKIKRGDSPGIRFIKFRKWLSEMVKNSTPDVIIYEQAHHRGGHATEIALGFVTETKIVAAENNCEVTTVHTGKLKKWATGSGKASKEKMIAASRKMGFDPKDDNEADALLILHWFLDQFKPRKIKRREK